MATLHVLKVFVGEDGAGGNPLGVFLEGGAVPEEDRQSIAADLGFSETVFVDDAERSELRIFTPGTELPFAGHGVAARAGGFGNTATAPAGGRGSRQVRG